MWYWYQNRYIDQWNKIKSPEINPCIYFQLTLTMVPRLYFGEFIVFLTDDAETCSYPHEKMNLEPYSYHIQNNSKQIKDLNVRADIVKLLKENRDAYTHDFSQAKLSYKTTKPQGTCLNLFRQSQKNDTHWVAYKQQIKTIISGVLGFQYVNMTRGGGIHIQTTVQPKVINWTSSILKTLEYQKTLSRK